MTEQQPTLSTRDIYARRAADIQAARHGGEQQPRHDAQPLDTAAEIFARREREVEAARRRGVR